MGVRLVIGGVDMATHPVRHCSRDQRVHKEGARNIIPRSFLFTLILEYLVYEWL